MAELKIKNTPLTKKHIALGAKMAAFAGYNMPISYSGIKEEHAAVRNGVGVFDVSHMGEFIVRGKDALKLVQLVTSNDASKLAIGQAQYSCLPNKKGGIVDDLLVYRLSEERCSAGEMSFMLVVNASNIAKDWKWIKKHAKGMEVDMVNISPKTGLLAVQGPKATEVLQKLTEVDLSNIPYYHFTRGTIAGIDNVIISATGYTGSGGFELYVESGKTVALWNAVFKAGKKAKIQPTGLGARDTLRLEMGYMLYGNDLDDTTSPIEAGLGWITKTKKGEFIGSTRFVKEVANGTKRKLVAFELTDKRVPRHGFLIEDAKGKEIGVVSSGTQSPSLDRPIGMGYVTKANTAIDTEIFIVISGKKFAAKVVKAPFYKK
jgi:aminomethyltransferase